MSLIQCPECGQNVSSAAKSCAGCGYPLHRAAPPAKKPKTRLFRTIILTTVIAIPAILLLKQSGDSATAGIVIQLVKIAGSVAVGVVIVWMIRQGVSRGMDDHERGK